MIGLKRGFVELFDHEKGWDENAAETIEKLNRIFGSSATDIQHVGSTSIIHIKAKPIIDIAVAVADFNDVYLLIPALEAEGFIHRPPIDEPWQIFFSCGSDTEDTRSHHIHVVLADSKQWQDYTNFRDYLNARPDVAKEYENIKIELMNRYKNDRIAYTDGKAEFIARTLCDALAWRTSNARVTNIRVIHIFGASGSGTTTIGAAVSKLFGFTHLDSDDFFWLPTNPPYITKRKVEERQKLLAESIEKSDRCVISGSFCGWGDMFIPNFDLVIYVDTPAHIRIDRLKEREYRHFGDRILPGGDMYKNHTEFIAWAERYDSAGLEQRSRTEHVEWLKNIPCPVLRVDGSQPLKDILPSIEKCIF